MAITKLQPFNLDTTANYTFANITATNANLGNAATANFFIGNGSLLTGISTTGLSNGNSNISIPTSNGNVNITATGNTTLIVTDTGINVAGYSNVTGNVNATYFVGNGAFLTGVDTSPSDISNGSSNVRTFLNGNVSTSAAGNADILVVTGTGINVAGTTTIGTGTGGNISGANLVSANFFTGTLVNGTSNVRIATTNGNVTIAAVGNTTMTITGTGANITGTANITGNVSAPFFIGNGAFLTGVDTSPSNISNGNSNVQVNANGNVITSVAGNANILVVTGTGANIAGTANVTGNIIGANLMGPLANGNSNVRIAAVNGNINLTAVGNTTMVVTGAGANIAGYANVTGNVSAAYFIGNGAFLTGVDTSPSNISNGTSNVQILQNGNVTTSVNGNANIIVVTGLGSNISGYLNATGNVSGGNVTAAGQLLSTQSTGTAPLVVLSTTQVANLNSALAGTVTTAAQPNITSVGNLTGLTVSNATGVVNLSNTANVTLGEIANLHISGGSANYVLKTDGTGNLDWVAVGGISVISSISNGNSNVNIATSNGNVSITAVGNTTMLVTGTGANIAGYANITGNVSLSGANVNLGNVSNLRIAGGASSYVLSTDGLSNLSWVAQSGGGGSSAAIQEFSATAGQTTFTVVGGYQVGSALVFVNGIQMNNGDYTATNGTTIVLAEPRIAGDVVRILSSMASPSININTLQNFSVAMSIALGV
jgi:hypothetical protein